MQVKTECEVSMLAQVESPAYMVRVFSGKRLPEERESVIRQAAERYFHDIQKKRQGNETQP